MAHKKQNKSSSKGSRKKSSKSSMKKLKSPEVTKTPNNQKKLYNSIYDVGKKDQSPNGNYTKFSSKIYRGSTYMPQFIKEVKEDKNLCKCMKCPDTKTLELGKVMNVNSLITHLRSEQHDTNTLPDEKNELQKLLILFEGKNQQKGSDDNKNKEEETKNYLHFIAFAISQNLSYSQIEKLGSYLQRANKEKKLGFLKGFTFDEHLILKITQDCFRPILLDEMKSHLNKTPYSLIIDNASFSGESVCALKVKYLATEWDESLKENITKIKNKIIALSSLKESSNDK